MLIVRLFSSDIISHGLPWVEELCPTGVQTLSGVREQ